MVLAQVKVLVGRGAGTFGFNDLVAGVLFLLCSVRTHLQKRVWRTVSLLHFPDPAVASQAPAVSALLPLLVLLFAGLIALQPVKKINA